MTTEHRIYPSHCHVLSPTIAKWAPLKIADVLALKQVEGFEGQSIYHHLNHPCQWIKLTGIVVATDEFYNRICYTLDDSSGATIECVCRAPPKPDLLPPKDANNLFSTGRSTAAVTKNKSAETKSNAIDEAKPAEDMVSADGPKLKGIDVGSVVKIKGTIGVYRGIRQIAMKIIHIIPDTAAEVVEWRARTAFMRDVISTPWVVTGEEETKCLIDAEREKWGDEEKKKRRIKKGGTEEERAARKKRERRQTGEVMKLAEQEKEAEQWAFQERDEERKTRERASIQAQTNSLKAQTATKKKTKDAEFKRRMGQVDLI